MQALSGTYYVTFPVIGKQAFDVPVERIAQDAINAAWPNLQQKLKAEIPKLAGGVKTQAIGAVLLICAVTIGAAWWVKRR